jgi:hypothetical protein
MSEPPIKNTDTVNSASNKAENVGEVVEKGDVVELYDDIGRELYEKSLEYDTAQLERDAKKVKRKLDFIVLPIVSSN